MLATTATAAFVLLLAAAAWSDLRSRRVTNQLVLVIFAAGLAARGVSLGPLAIALGVAGAAVGLAVLLPPFAARWVGGGDVKLLAACGAWLGPWGALVGALLGIALGGALAAAMALVGGAGREVANNLRAAIVTLTAPVAPTRRRALVVPLALPIAVGCAIVRLGGVA